MIHTCAKVAATPLELPLCWHTYPNVVPQKRDNIGLWDGAPLGLTNVPTGMCFAPRAAAQFSECHRRPDVRSARYCAGGDAAGRHPYHRA